MKFLFREKMYTGTESEIKDQLIVDLRDLLGYNHNQIQKVLDRVIKIKIKIGIDEFSGTSAEILDQFINAQKIAPIVCESFCNFTVLGVITSMAPGEHICKIRGKVIAKVKRMIEIEI